MFVSDEQKRAYAVFEQDVALQRERNTRLAGEMLAELKKRTDLAPYQDDLLLQFFVAYQTFEQGLGQVDAKAAPWIDGLRSGQFDPVCEILDERQQDAIFQVLSGQE